MRLIDADALQKVHQTTCPTDCGVCPGSRDDLTCELIDRAPTVADAVIVTRCKDCEFCGKYLSGGLYCKNEDGLLGTKPDAFCNLGVRKDGGNEP